MPGKSDYSVFNHPHQSDQRRHKWTSNQCGGRQHLCSRLGQGLWLWMSSETVQCRTTPSLPFLSCQGDNVTIERDYNDTQSMFIQSWFIQTTGMPGICDSIYVHDSTNADFVLRRPVWQMFSGQSDSISCLQINLLGTVCSGKMGKNKAPNGKARRSVKYSTCSPWTKRVNSTNGLPSVQLEHDYSLINGGATHSRKCPIAWDSKWFIYASWLCRAGMMKRWLLLPVKHGAIL